MTKPYLKNFLAAVQISGTMFPGEVPTQKRIEVLKPFFDPPVGSSITLHPKQLIELNYMQEPLKAVGFIEVIPPPNKCLIIQRKLDEKDDIVCTRKRLSFHLKDVDYKGLVRWKVTTGHGDVGTEVTWSTPYRIMQRARAGNLFKESIPEYLMSCKRTFEPIRQIEVATMTGEKLIIRFPEFDTLMPQPEKGPNLVVLTNLDGPTEGGEGEEGAKKKPAKKAPASDSQSEEKPPSPEDHSKKNKPEEGKKDEHGDSSKDGPEKKPEEWNLPIEKKEYDPTIEQDPSANGTKKIDPDAHRDVFTEMSKKRGVKLGYYWNMYPLATYIMPSYNIVTIGAPKDSKGICRYRFIGAPFDKASGGVECTYTESDDTIFIPMSCSQDLGPKLSSSPQK